MKIRLAQPSDADACARVHVDTWRSAYKSIMPGEVLDKLSHEKRAEEWRRCLSDAASASFTFIAESEGLIVGFATGGPERDGNAAYKGELWTIYILEKWQRKGIGRQLTLAVAQNLQRRGFNSMLIWVFKDNPNRTFYERLGGVTAGERVLEIGGKKLIEVAYGWDDLSALLVAQVRRDA
jgi:GNAT superfamily N-acetyltransferase